MKPKQQLLRSALQLVLSFASGNLISKMEWWWALPIWGHIYVVLTIAIIIVAATHWAFPINSRSNN